MRCLVPTKMFTTPSRQTLRRKILQDAEKRIGEWLNRRLTRLPGIRANSGNKTLGYG